MPKNESILFVPLRANPSTVIAGQGLPHWTCVLTRRGWLAHEQVHPPEDETIGWNPFTGRSEWTPITRLRVYQDADLVRLANKTWVAVCTPHHRWVAVHWRQTAAKGRHGRTRSEYTRENVTVQAQAITSRHSLRLAASGDLGAGPAISEQEAELLGWVLGDGSVARMKSKPGSDPQHWRTGTGSLTAIRVYQSKPGHCGDR